MQVRTQKFVSEILCCVTLVYDSCFFITRVLRKLFDIRVSYKHCNFSGGCLLVKMASKTLIRSIKSHNRTGPIMALGSNHFNTSL